MRVVEYVLTDAYKISTRNSFLAEKPDGHVLLKPLIASICGSDLQYFRGQKSYDKLSKRLPLVLLHEGVAMDVQTREKVVVVPLQSCGICYSCKDGNENLCIDARFMASTVHGLSRSLFYYPKELILTLDKKIPQEIAVLTEPLSIAVNIVQNLTLKGSERIVVIGDGAMAYFCVLMLSYLKKINKKSLFTVGIKQHRLNCFDKFSTIIDKTSEEGKTKLNSLYGTFDVAIEVVGGNAMADTIKEAICLLKNLGKLAVLGLSDKLVPIEFIQIVNRGINLRGFTRSTVKDFEKALELMKNNDFTKKLRCILDNKTFLINNADDLTEAFHYASVGMHTGRVLVKFKF